MISGSSFLTLNSDSFANFNSIPWHPHPHPYPPPHPHIRRAMDLPTWAFQRATRNNKRHKIN